MTLDSLLNAQALLPQFLHACFVLEESILAMYNSDASASEVSYLTAPP